MSAVQVLGWTDKALADLDRRRGWTEDAIDRFALTWDATSGRVGIPVRDSLGGERGELRYDPTGRRKPKMVASAGSSRELFPPPEMISDDELDEQRTVWLVEGEPDAIRLWSLGVPAVAVPGAQNWRHNDAPRFTGRRWRVIVCFDCDGPGRENAARAAAAIVNAGGDARLLDLDPREQHGYDLTDWLRKADTAELRAQAAAALAAIADSLQLYRPPPRLDFATGELEPLDDVTDAEFAAVDEPGAKAIVGSADAPLIPGGGDAMVYGDGGVGKTTLCLDLAYHLAAGDPWLGIPVDRPLRVLIIENEGPRPLFRTKIRRKRAAWQGSPTEDRVRVIERPWAKFTFADLERRIQLADLIRRREIDVVIIGPLASSGMEAAGTLQDVREFLALVDDVRDRSGRPALAIILVHHENKGGQVSGAWEGAGDTLIHVTQHGHRKIRVYFQKARWASDLHATSLDLAWADGDTFTVDAKPELNDAEIADRIEAAIRANPGTAWGRVEKQITGVANDDRRRIRDQLLHAGLIVNVGKNETKQEVALDHVPERRTARLYPADDPTIRHLRPEPGADAAQTAPPGGELAAAHLRPAPRRISGAGVGAEGSRHPNDDHGAGDDAEIELARELEKSDW